MARLLKIDRHMIGQLWAPFSLGVAGLLFMLTMRALFDLGELVIRQGAPLGVVFGLLLANLPRLLVLVLPAGVLLAVLTVYGRMGSDSELTALRAAGVPLTRQARPALLFGLLMTLAGLGLTHQLIPMAAERSRELADRLIQLSDPFRMVHPREIFDQIPGLTLYVDSVNPEARRFGGIFVHEVRADGGEQISLASSGTLAIDKTSGRISLSLENGHTYEFPPDNPNNLRETTFAVQQIGGQLPQNSMWAAREVRADTVWQLTGADLRRIMKGSSGADPELRRAARLEWLTRWTLPLAGLILALMAVPLSLAAARGGRGAALGVALLVFAVYGLLQSLLINLAQGGKLSPWIAALLPSLVFSVLGAWLLRRRSRRDDAGESRLAARWHAWRERRAARLAAAQESRPEPAGEEAEVQYREAGRAAGRLAPNLLDAYIVRVVARYTLYTLLGIMMLNLLVDLRGVVDDAARNKIPAWQVALLLASGVPERLQDFVPFAILIGVLVGFGALSRGSELVAMRAAGISIWRQGLPALLLASVLALAMFAAGETVVPLSARTHWQLMETVKRKQFSSGRYEDRSWLFGSAEGTLYHYHRLPSVDGRDSALADFTYLKLDFPTGRLMERVAADEVRFENGRPVARAGLRRVRDGEGWKTESLERTPLALPDERDYFIPKERFRADSMSARELREYATVLERKRLPGADRVRVSYHGKYASAFSCLVMALLGLAFAFRTGRSGSLVGIGIGVMLGVLFLQASNIMDNLGMAGLEPPLLAAWGANGLALFAALHWYRNEAT